jgi:tRNA pseudouridine55 synthase
LDPFATGVLVLLIGRATRLAQFYRDREKTYRGVIRFGFATDTMDGTGRPVSPDGAPALPPDAIREVFAALTGAYEQRPPAYSAKKIAGAPAYRLARAGRPVELSPTEVTVHRLELLWCDGPRAGFETQVSSGTYIRALVNDMGERLGVGAHLAELRRTAVGEFGEQAAQKLDRLEDESRKGGPSVISMETLLPEFPAVSLRESEADRVAHGMDLELEAQEPRVKLLDPAGRLCGIGERVPDGRYHPAVVLSGEKTPVAAARAGASAAGETHSH